jgi:acyl-CoA synthetase (AMP-forming)/AMP-acid ligase II
MLNNVIKILVTNASRRPDETAIVCGNQQMTYAQLYEHSSSCRLSDTTKFESETACGSIITKWSAYLLSYYGCLIAGGLPVLLPTYLSSNKLTYNINKLKIDTIIFDSEFQKTVEDIELKKGTPLKKIIKQDLFAHPARLKTLPLNHYRYMRSLINRLSFHSRTAIPVSRK